MHRRVVCINYHHACSYNVTVNSCNQDQYLCFPIILATALANEYGNACNAVLHAAACTYQALVLSVDCKTGLYLS